MWIVIPGQAQWLKEFFDVKMIVSNLAPTPFTFDSGSISLNDLPAGLSLAPVNPAPSITHTVSDIPAGGSVASDWVLRGDLEGYYGVSATYTGTLDPGAFPLSFQIATQPGAIHVWGGSAIQMTVDTDNAATLGDPYLVRVGLTNASDVPVYNAGVELLTTGRLNYIYQPDQQLGYETSVIEPGATFWTDYYRLIPEITGTLDLSQSFVKQTGGNVDPTSTIVSHPATPADPLTATSEQDGVHLSWATPSVSGITGYEIFYTPTRDALFGSTPVATLPASATSTVIAHGLSGYYAVSTVTADGLTDYHDLAQAAALHAGAAITVTPATLIGSGKTKFAGSGFGSGKVVLHLDSATGTTLASANASSSGTFAKSVKVPALAGGTHLVVAVGSDGSTATASLTVSAGVTLKSTSAKPGASDAASLVGFEAGESVTLDWGGATGVTVGSATASTSGTGTATLTVPNVAKGTYTVYAEGSDGTTATASLKVK
jgi:hypothetical protein